MGGPLSPRSPDIQNRQITIMDLDEVLKTPTFPYKSIDLQPMSSPFQPEVDQENQPPITSMNGSVSPSPLKSRKSPTKSFVIHDDDRIRDAITIDFGDGTPDKPAPDAPTPRSIPQEPTYGDISTMPLKGCPPYANTPHIPEMNISIEEDLQEDCDARTTVSEDTCFSTFSAIPNADVTLFANTNNFMASMNANEFQADFQRDNITPKSGRRTSGRTGSTASQSPTPRRQISKAKDNTTNLLLDFTQQFESFPKASAVPSSAAVRGSPVRMHTDSSLFTHLQKQRSTSPNKQSSYLATPATSRTRMLNLLDFDLPPQPTPRSIPSITAREHTKELESLKSGYLSEITSLKASLSGREAEVHSLKKAADDAEYRVGEALDKLQGERSAREQAEIDRTDWEKKGREVNELLQSLRAELEDMHAKLEESTNGRIEAEARANEALQRAALTTQTESNGSTPSNEALEALIQQRVTQQLDSKIEALARELHGVYKAKHETKVATLKKTYEARSEKRTQELQHKVLELTEQCEELQARDGNSLTQSHSTQIIDLQAQLDTLTQSNADLGRELERERAEKGDLVAAVDEMLALQAESQSQSIHNFVTTATSSDPPSAVEHLRRSIGAPRPSGLKAPGGPPSRLSRGGGVAPQKSRMMSSIERMGSGRGIEAMRGE